MECIILAFRGASGYEPTLPVRTQVEGEVQKVVVRTGNMGTFPTGELTSKFAPERTMDDARAVGILVVGERRMQEIHDCGRGSRGSKSVSHEHEVSRGVHLLTSDEEFLNILLGIAREFTRFPHGVKERSRTKRRSINFTRLSKKHASQDRKKIVNPRKGEEKN